MQSPLSFSLGGNVVLGCVEFKFRKVVRRLNSLIASLRNVRLKTSRVTESYFYHISFKRERVAGVVDRLSGVCRSMRIFLVFSCQNQFRFAEFLQFGNEI